MMTSETRPGSMPARSSAALMAMAPRSWAGVVANAPLKLPTGVRAALTMTTSSDMGISWSLRFLGLGCWTAGGRPLACVSLYILLTALRHVNRQSVKSRRAAFKMTLLGGFLSNLYALELTVPHKTVAETL